jgi:endonuclease-3 related protein
MSEGETPGPDLLLDVFQRLLDAHGPQHWWPAQTPFEVMVGAILTQNTAWTNVERAIASLKAADALTPHALRTLPLNELALLVRPSGYFNMKAKKLRALGEYLGRYGDDLDTLFSSKPLDELRAEVLSVYGVGPETADSILLYAGVLPVFVVDAYTVRILSRLGLLDGPAPYDQVQSLFQRALPLDAALFNEFHALFVVHGKDVCRARSPLCGGCPLVTVCATGRRAAEAMRASGAPS